MIKRRLLIGLTAILLLSGCWDIKDLQDVNYAVSVGLDYKQGKYIIYAQYIDFSFVSKQETGKVSEPPLQWVGKGEGETIDLAMNNLFNTTQQRTMWSHITNVVLTNDMLTHGLENVEETLSRFREIRYTPWVYGTHESIEDIYTTPGFFNFTVLNTILNEPMEHYEQKSYIKPMRYVRFISIFREPDQTILLPSISVNKDQWKKNNKNEKKLAVNGVFAIKNNTLKGWFDKESLVGLRWMEPSTVRSPLAIKNDGKIIAVISAGRPKIGIRYIAEEESPHFSITLKLEGELFESLDSITESELIEKAQQKIKEEVMTTYENGLKHNVDLYSLEHVLYRKNFRLWKKTQEEDGFQLNKESIRSLDVEVNITHSGMIRTKVRKMPPEK
ncbi:Ger(x)C family spore germination protein [Paenibacillus sp. J2TS4]|uniref:Ger(x)C family spore germination protein n=1 Tax=Paenibacillus sp. J2TS4 TaxID=2807194 RepID=UPI001B151648|nr:Ger(x)C family spore germination protein [Paenibacillus sp. J2TS4]GIP33224.1 hypothetical protein J2TS4_24340 [Paenibacillus sp. J2TS4]